MSAEHAGTSTAGPTLVFDVGDFAYGSVSMALALAGELAGSARLIALGRGEAIGQLRADGRFADVLNLSDPTLPIDRVLSAAPDAWCDFHSDDLRSWRWAAASGVPYVHISMHGWRVEKAAAAPYHVPQA